jgi:hypothetical protein
MLPSLASPLSYSSTFAPLGREAMPTKASMRSDTLSSRTFGGAADDSWPGSDITGFT